MKSHLILKKRMSHFFTVRHTVKITAFFFIILFIGFMNCTDVHAENKEDVFKNLHAMSAVLMDADTMRVLGEKDGRTKRPMASTTKILTAVIALENGRLHDVVTVSDNASRQPRVHMGMKEGEQYYLGDLLYSLLLESHNDSAVAIAEFISGSTEEFAVLMNRKAASIGCRNSYFITPNGLDAKGVEGFHGTTAEDLARIMSYCVTKSCRKNEFIKISQTRKYVFAELNDKRQVTCINHNRFLDMMKGVTAGKTGFTGEAGYCYVGAFEKEGAEFVVSLLGCGWPDHKDYKWKDCLKLSEYAGDRYGKVNRKIHTGPLYLNVKNGILESSKLFDKVKVPLKIEAAKESFDVIKREEEIIVKIIQLPESINGSLKKGSRVGKILYKINGHTVGEFPVVTEKKVRKCDYSWILLEIIDIYLKCSYN